jgi:dolichol kinase
MTLELKPDERILLLSEKTKAYVLSSLLIIIVFLLVNLLGLLLTFMNFFTIVLLFTMFFISTGIIILYSDRLETVSIEKWGKTFRKYSHLAGGVVMIFFCIISPIQLSWICFSLFVVFSIHEYFYVRRNTPGIYTRTLIFIGRMDRKSNSETTAKPKPFLPTLWVLAAIAIIGLFGENIALSAIIAFALGDSLSAIIGERFGRHKLIYNRTKSLEGSLAFFGVTFIGVYCVYYLVGITAWIPALIAASVGTLIESLIPTSHWLDDNFIVPVGVGFVLFFTQIFW